MEDDQTPRKRRTCRRAFEVPDIVDDRNVSEAIARQMVGAVPWEPSTHSDKVDPRRLSWKEATFGPALVHVHVFIEALFDGDLDLPLCGFGTVSGPDTHHDMIEASPATSAGDVLRTRLGEGEPYVSAWFDWLWIRLSQYVSEVPFDALRP
jgi:hypothetical protein